MVRRSTRPRKRMRRGSSTTVYQDYPLRENAEAKQSKAGGQSNKAWTTGTRILPCLDFIRSTSRLQVHLCRCHVKNFF